MKQRTIVLYGKNKRFGLTAGLQLKPMVGYWSTWYDGPIHAIHLGFLWICW